MFLPFIGILKLIMTERNDTSSERMALSTVKSEVLTHELSMGDRELGLQPVPLAYPQQVGLSVCLVQYSSTTAYYLQLTTTQSTKQCPCSYLVNSTEVYFCTILLSFILSYLSFSLTHPSSSSIGATARCGLWPIEQYLSIFPYLSPTLFIFSLPALEDLFLLLLSILSWVFLFILSLPVLE